MAETDKTQIEATKDGCFGSPQINKSSRVRNYTVKYMSHESVMMAHQKWKSTPVWPSLLKPPSLICHGKVFKLQGFFSYYFYVRYTVTYGEGSSEKHILVYLPWGLYSTDVCCKYLSLSHLSKNTLQQLEEKHPLQVSLWDCFFEIISFFLFFWSRGKIVKLIFIHSNTWKRKIQFKMVWKLNSFL